MLSTYVLKRGSVQETVSPEEEEDDASMASTRTRARLAFLEEELRRLREKDERRESRRQKRVLVKERLKQIEDIFAAAEAVDLLFLMDFTGSMRTYIQEVKTTIQACVANIKKIHPGLKLRLSFVGYRDFSDDERLVMFPFCDDVKLFQDFLGEIKAMGGGDTPEDVFGGIDLACRQDWEKQTRLMIHIADAPCHGSRFHGDPLHDDYPLKDGKDHKGLSAEGVLSKVKEKGIEYFFYHVKRHLTTVMIQEFNKIACAEGLAIHDVDLVNCTSLASHVVTSVTTSITGTLGQIMKKGERKIRVQLDPSIPDWQSMPWESAMEMVCVPPRSIDDIKKDEEMQVTQRATMVKFAMRPFAQGGQRVAHYGLIKDAVGGESSIVLKKFIKRKETFEGMSGYDVQMQSQAIAGFLAQEFNKASGSTCSDVLFLPVRTVHITSRSSPMFANVEPHIDSFEKYNSNCGYVHKDIHAVVQAFSHWTYKATDGYLMIVDLQGMIKGSEYRLTDPAIHCKDLRFGMTNMCRRGFKQFFATHVCNNVCKAIGLTPVDARDFD